MLSGIIGALLQKVAPKVADYYMDKEEQKHLIEMEKLRGKQAWEEAKTRRASESEGRDHAWELESIRNSGWKDELVIIVLTIPLVLVFIPFTQPYVETGFRHLEMTPDWYRFLILSIYGATFGIRLWRRK